MCRRRGTWLAAAAAALVSTWAAGASPARAQAHPPVTDPDYAIDLYSGAALGGLRLVGMGGAALGTAEGSAGTLVNPAAAAVRATTSDGWWDWDFHLDWLVAVPGQDFDNSGVADREGYANRLETYGLAGMMRGWGVAATVSSAGVDLTGAGAAGGAGADDDALEARALRGKVAVARQTADEQWTLGLGLRVGTFEIAERRARVRTTLLSLDGAGLEVGGLWRQPRGDWRVGVTASLPISGSDVAVADDGCTLEDCRGYILPSRVEVPWQLAAGVAWRWAPTRWNQHIPLDFRDEPAWLLAADVVVTGAVAGGHGLEAFGRQELQRSGNHAVVSVRAGAEHEWIPGRLRVRAGSYWEPGRLAGPGGRLHGTLGVEAAVFGLKVWRWFYRVRLSLTADVAARYGNGGISVGFWH